MTRYYIAAGGVYLGGFENANPPAGSVEVPFPPEDGRMLWDGTKWTIPDSLQAIFDKQAQRDKLAALGYTSDDLVQALWDKIMNDKSDAADAIQSDIGISIQPSPGVHITP